MNMIEVKTSELIGPALNYATAISIGLEVNEVRICKSINWCADVIVENDTDAFKWECFGDVFCFVASTNWSQCGQIIEGHNISLHCPKSMDDVWAAWVVTPGGEFCCGGETPLIAACRAIVAAKLGDVVSVPAELVNGGGL